MISPFCTFFRWSYSSSFLQLRSFLAAGSNKNAEHIDKFVNALEESNLHGEYNAIFLETPDNSFDANFEVLKSLQLRLHEIEKMDITSFQYQTAIQQITQQEQGEASNMLSEFSGIWWKTNHFMLWDWIGISQVIFLLIMLLIGTIIWNEYYY